MAALDQVAGSSFGKTIKDVLDEERSTKSSLEAKGIGIVTSSGGLTSLLFALVTFTQGTNPQLHWNIGAPAKAALIAGVILFAAAALCGLAANFPRGYREASVEKLKERVSPGEWSERDPVEAARRDARTYVEIIEQSREINKIKATAVRWGIAAEAVAAVAVALAAGLQLVGL